MPNGMYCGLDGTISYDAWLLNTFAGTFGDFAASTFLAHEWGHLNQAALFGRLPTNKLGELHADCQAGMYAAAEEAQGRSMGNDVCGAFAQFCAIGDPLISPWFVPGAHGTCAERTAAFERGYRGAQAHIERVCDRRSVVGAIRDICGSY